MTCYNIVDLTGEKVRLRLRRGKLVAIPREWWGVITTKETIRQRKFPKIRKRRELKHRLRVDRKFDFEQQLEYGYETGLT